MTPEQLQNQKNMEAAGLTPEQQAGVASGKGYATVPNASMKPSTAVTIPTKTQDTTNYNADITGGQATIDANNKDLTKTTPPPTATDQYVSSLKELDVPSTAGQYATDYAKSGIATNQQDVLAKQQALNTAQSKLAGINARLAGITAEAKAQQLSLEGQGRGIPTDILSGQSAEISRRTAIRALPIQAEALGAQAEVQAAQGNVQLAQDTLRLAQDRLNTVFTMHTEDAKNKYNAQKDLISAVYTQASAKEKTLLDAKLKEEERAYQERKDNVNNAQQWALKAMENGQASLASQITALDPKSPDYVQKLAGLQGQITPDTTDKLYKQLQIKKLQQEMGVGGKNGVDISEATGKPLTEGERKAKGYAERATEADAIIKTLENKFTGASSYVGQILPNIFKTAERQQFEQAQRNFVNAILRPESGAVINPDEFDNARIQYFPQPGDGADVVAQKRLNRETKIKSLLIEGGQSITGDNNDPLGILKNG